MREAERISIQSRKMIEGGAWHGPALIEALTDVDADLAAAHPVHGAHSIWELVLHITAVQAVILRRIQGERAGLEESEFWPEVPTTSPGAWSAAIERLKTQDAELQQRIAAFADDKLETPLMQGGTSAYDNFHGHVQHTAYHAGQIVLLKKLGRR